MEALNIKTAQTRQYPTKIIQFGEGNFLRAFVDWIVWNTNRKTDFNAGVVAEGESLDVAGQRLFDEVVAIASGKQVKSEKAGFHDMAIFKQGVTL